MKRCADCKEVKEYADFPPSKKSKDGRHSYCKACNDRRSRESRERLYGSSRHYHLMHRYGISAVEFDEIVKQQGGACARCVVARIPSTWITTTRPDRSAASCASTCNGGLGQFRDSIDALENAVSYLIRADPNMRELDELAVERARGLRGLPV